MFFVANVVLLLYCDCLYGFAVAQNQRFGKLFLVKLWKTVRHKYVEKEIGPLIGSGIQWCAPQ